MINTCAEKKRIIDLGLKGWQKLKRLSGTTKPGFSNMGAVWVRHTPFAVTEHPTYRK